MNLSEILVKVLYSSFYFFGGFSLCVMGVNFAPEFAKMTNNQVAIFMFSYGVMGLSILTSVKAFEIWGLIKDE